MMEDEVCLKVIHNGRDITIKTNGSEYSNLMTLLRDTLLLDMFGQCGGMGRCATCLVEAEGINGISRILERNEPSTLEKYGLNKSNARLSCQLYVSKDLEGAVFKILDV